MKTLSLEVVRDFASLFFPNYCAACEGTLLKGEDIICTKCLLELPKSNYHLDPENPFIRKMKGRIPVKRVFALYKFSKSSRVQHLLHTLKYNNRPEIGTALGKIYGADLCDVNLQDEIDLILPVPLHPTRKRSRGYNQSEEFGKGLSQLLHAECSDEIIRRTHKTETQTRRTKLQRWRNVSDGFEVAQRDRVRGKKILLVDDVITTGATIEACAQILVEAGCAELSVGCIAAAQ